MIPSSKQLREWDIVLKVKDKLSYIFHLLLYYKVVLFCFIILAVIAYLFFDRTNYILIYEILLTCLTISTVYLLDRNRKFEIGQIRNLINQITNNSLLNSQSISLDKNLSPLETDIMLMFEKIQNDFARLEKLQRIRSEFLGNVSHELRTPIFTIQGFLETLLDGAIDNPKVNRNFLEKAKTHTISLSNLLNDLIDISMIESGEMRLSFRYFFLNEFLLQIVSELIPIAEAKNLRIVFRPNEKNLQVFGDKNKLRQVFINLIQNAIKYTDEGTVEIILTEEEKNVKIEVRDSGIGIPEYDLSRIFERFYRVDKARSRAAGGTGLGLAIVKHIVEAHGSKVEVQSEVSKGSVFSFRLKKG